MTADSNNSQARTVIFIYPVTQAVTDLRCLLHGIARIQKNEVRRLLQFQQKEKHSLQERQCFHSVSGTEWNTLGWAALGWFHLHSTAPRAESLLFKLAHKQEEEEKITGSKKFCGCTALSILCPYLTSCSSKVIYFKVKTISFSFRLKILYISRQDIADILALGYLICHLHINHQI